jgi:hypothetical protein
MAKTVLNARHGAGVLKRIDVLTGEDGRTFPVAVVKAADGSLKALHFSEPGQIAALAKAAPSIGDRLSLSADNLHVDRPDNFGERGMTRVPASDWAKWGNAAYRRSPGGHDALHPEPVSPAPAVAAPRMRRPIRLPDGRFATTDEAMPSATRGQVVADGRGGLEIRR